MSTTKKYYIAGIVLLLIYFLPFILLGDNAYYRIHDYLEQDYVYLKLNAKYLFHPFVYNIPDLFNGTYRGSIQHHSLLLVFLCKLIGSGVHLLIINMIATAFVGYTGMYLLINKLYEKEVSSNLLGLIACTTSFLFGIQPVLLHGLTALVFPLFIYSLITIYREKENKYIKWGILSLAIGLGTSLIYSCCVYLLFLLGSAFISYKRNLQSWKVYLSNFILMLFGYISTYFYSFLSLLEASHRGSSLEANKYNSFLNLFSNRFLHGYMEVDTNNIIIGSLTLILCILTIFFIKKNNKLIISKNIQKGIIISLTLMLIISFISAFFQFEPISIFIKDHFFILNIIRVKRLGYYISPLGFFLLATTFIGFAQTFKNLEIKYKNILTRALIILTVVCQFLFITQLIPNITWMFNIQTLLGQQIKFSEKKLKNKRIPKLTYKEFFDEETMSKIKEYIGKPCSEYRVVSIGINPGVALYNEMYCLDGYSTSYRMSYKNSFREVIKASFIKGEHLGHVYDTWGSRAYIVTSNARGYNFADAQPITEEINFKALKSLGCNYIISHYPLNGVEKYVTLCKRFDSPSYKNIYLYELK